MTFNFLQNSLSVLQNLSAWLFPQLLASYFALDAASSPSTLTGTEFIRAAHLQV